MIATRIEDVPSRQATLSVEAAPSGHEYSAAKISEETVSSILVTRSTEQSDSELIGCGAQFPATPATLPFLEVSTVPAQH